MFDPEELLEQVFLPACLCIMPALIIIACLALAGKL